MKRTRSLVARAGLIGFAGIAMVGGNGALAVHEDLEFPAAIHAGTCEAPGDEVLALDNLVRLPEDGESEENQDGGDEENRAGAPGSQVVHGLPDGTTIDLTIDDLFAEDHILAVFDAEGANIIACGPIGAYSYEDGDELYFGLRSQGESPYSGVAILGSDDDDTGLDAGDLNVDESDDTDADAGTDDADTDAGDTGSDDADDTGTDDAGDTGTDETDADTGDSDEGTSDDEEGLEIEIYLVNNTPAPTGDAASTPAAGGTTDVTTDVTPAVDGDATDDTADDATDDSDDATDDTDEETDEDTDDEVVATPEA